MTTVRIAHSEPRPGDLGNGTFVTHGYLVVLADDAGHRALPVWLREPSGGSLAELLEPDAEIVTARAPEELTARLLRTAGARLTGVDIDVPDASELDPRTAVARIELTGPAGARQIAARFGLGLAMAVATGAPVRVPDEVMDRLAVPVTGDDLLGPVLDRVPPPGRTTGGRIAGWPYSLPARRPRFEPRNLSFADGLDRWDLDGGSGGSYSSAAEDRSAVLFSSAQEPYGSAALVQTIFADDYQGATIAFRGEISTRPLTRGVPYEAGLRLEFLRERWQVREDHGVTVTGRNDWTRHEVTALVPDDAEMIRFGVTLTGPGRIALRDPELARI
jgi:bifunctional DNase/RNase